MLCAIITVGTNLTIPYIIGKVIDALNEGQLTTDHLIHYLTGFLLLSVASIIFSRLLRRIPMKLSHQIEFTIRRNIFQHLTHMDGAFFRSHHTGDLMTRMSSDINIVRDAIGQGLLQGSRTLIVILFASIVMGISSPDLALIVLVLFTPMVIAFFLIIRKMRTFQQALQEKVSDISNYCQESFSGIRCLKGFAIEDRKNHRFSTLSRQLLQKTMQMQSTRQLLWPLMAFWFNLGTILIFYVGGKKVMNGTISLGTLAQFIQYLLYMQWPLLALSWVLSMLQRGKVSWNRIQQILESPPAIADPARPEKADSSYDVHFEDVSLDIDAKRLLNHINLHIPQGTILGITGPTGSGKSLLASLVARLHDPTEGSVRIGQTDLRNMTLSDLRNRIGYTMQEPVLFSQTLEKNIGFGLPEADSSRVKWAAQIAHLDPDIQNFPDQYETLLGERGVTLSGGQRQRTALSRAIAKKPDILILDDVLSAVDTQTEASIMEKIQPIMARSTTLFISHRISTLRYADHIIVIEDGSITQQGTHNELITQPGYYLELNTMQQIEQQLEANA